MQQGSDKYPNSSVLVITLVVRGMPVTKINERIGCDIRRFPVVEKCGDFDR